MSEGSLPDSPKSYVRYVLGLGWMPALVALERAADEHFAQAAIYGSAAVIMLFADYWFFVRKGKGRMFSPAMGMVVGATIFIASLIWWFYSPGRSSDAPTAVPAPKSATNPTTAKAAVPAYFETPLTLQNLFDTDFQLFKRTQELTLRFQNSEREITVPHQLLADFESRTKFLAYYIPRLPDTFEVIAYFASTFRTQLDDSSVQVRMSRPGDSAATTLDELTFSGRIYIYHEEEMSLQQKASLETSFRAQGAAVQFRGHDYHVLHWNEQRVKPNTGA